MMEKVLVMQNLFLKLLQSWHTKCLHFENSKFYQYWISAAFVLSLSVYVLRYPKIFKMKQKRNVILRPNEELGKGGTVQCLRVDLAMCCSLHVLNKNYTGFPHTFLQNCLAITTKVYNTREKGRSSVQRIYAPFSNFSLKLPVGRIHQ